MIAARGLGAGAAGALAVAAADRLEEALLGGAPVYAPARMARRLSAKLFSRPLGPRASARAGNALRIGYALALGIAYAAIASSPARAALRALAFGCGVAAGELVALPLLGATPPARRWPPGEAPLLFAHATSFAAAAELALAASRRRLGAQARLRGGAPDALGHATLGPLDALGAEPRHG